MFLYIIAGLVTVLVTAWLERPFNYEFFFASLFSLFSSVYILFEQSEIFEDLPGTDKTTVYWFDYISYP